MMRRSIPSLLLIALLAGCTAGPDYAGPPEILSADTGHRFVRAGEDVVVMDPALAEWWVLLDDPELTRLVETALSENPSLQAAQARIAQARASVRQDRAGRMPTLGTQATTIQGQLPGLEIQEGAPPSSQQPDPEAGATMPSAFTMLVSMPTGSWSSRAAPGGVSRPAKRRLRQRSPMRRTQRFS